VARGMQLERAGGGALRAEGVGAGVAARCARRERAPGASRVGAGVTAARGGWAPASRRVEEWRWAAVSRRPGVGDGERGWRSGAGVAAGWRWAATSRRGRDGGGRRRRGQDGEGCGGAWVGEADRVVSGG
jgi:hypothetical protein